MTACGAVIGAALGLGLVTMAGSPPSGNSGGTAAPAAAEPVAVAAEPNETPSDLKLAALDASTAPAEPPAGAATGAEQPSATVAKTIAVSKGDTLMKVLLRAGADRREAHEAIVALSRVFNPRRLKAGQEVTVTFLAPQPGETKSGLAAVAIAASVERDVFAKRQHDGSFVAEELTRSLERRLVRGSGAIDDSLYLAARRADLPIAVLMEMIRIFSWDVDFQRDIQPGDRFEVAFERFLDEEGRAVREGDVLYTALTLSGTRLAFYRYTPPQDGIVDYFDERGQSARKALLRTPLDGARLTSRYGKRKHPILGYTRVHRGVDFGAPKGTPIFAAGDGVVEAAGWEGNFGRYIRLRHNTELKSAYAHMSRIAKGVGRGKRVGQGRVIGFVGSTGLSTGPHLHYEVIVKGRKVNPMSVKLPTGRRLKGDELARFQEALAELKPRIAEAETLGAQVARRTACGEAKPTEPATPC